MIRKRRHLVCSKRISLFDNYGWLERIWRTLTRFSNCNCFWVRTWGNTTDINKARTISLLLFADEKDRVLLKKSAGKCDRCGKYGSKNRTGRKKKSVCELTKYGTIQIQVGAPSVGRWKRSTLQQKGSVRSKVRIMKRLTRPWPGRLLFKPFWQLPCTVETISMKWM